MSNVWGFLIVCWGGVKSGVGIVLGWVWAKRPRTRRGKIALSVALIVVVAVFALIGIWSVSDSETRRFMGRAIEVVAWLWFGVVLLEVLIARKIPGKLWRAIKRGLGKLEKAVICLLIACGAVSVGWYLYYCQQWQTQLAGAGLGMWLVICIAKGFVGTITPAQGLLIRFGRVVKAIESGWYPVFYPLERIKKIPTSQYPPLVYQINKRIYAKANKVLSAQLLEVVEVSLYLQLPMVGKIYHILDATTGMLVAISGGKLLMDCFYPRRPMRNLFGQAWGKWQEHLKPAVMGVAGNVLSNKTSKECNEQRAAIAGQIKDGLFVGVGNPFYACGIPLECVGVAITQVKLLDEIDLADIGVQVAKRKAQEATSIKKEIVALTSGYMSGGLTAAKAAPIVATERRAMISASASAPVVAVATPQQTPQPAQQQATAQPSNSDMAIGLAIYAVALFLVGFFIYKMVF